jgi:hypothetical protein
MVHNIYVVVCISMSVDRLVCVSCIMGIDMLTSSEASQELQELNKGPKD